MNWWKRLKGKIKHNVSLRNYTTFKIGGPAKYFVEPKDIADLKLLLFWIKRYKLPLLVIGRGSNLLINDKGINAVVLRLSSAFFKKISFSKSSVFVKSAVPLSQLLTVAEKQGLSGLEFLAGIPGTIGGALVMNAGIPERCISEVVEKVLVMDYNGNIKTLNKKEIKFSYRGSNLSKYIVLEAKLNLLKTNKEIIKNRIKMYLNRRRRIQDYTKPSAGCVFKNPQGKHAGRLIDLCGLKGKRIGGACISTKHANFILNKGNARAVDILKLMALVKKEVKKKFNIILQPEIKIWQ